VNAPIIPHIRKFCKRYFFTVLSRPLCQSFRFRQNQKLFRKFRQIARGITGNDQHILNALGKLLISSLRPVVLNRAGIPEDKKDLFEALPNEYSHLYFAKNGKIAACILIKDPMRKEARSVVEHLREQGFQHIVMMTGDSEKTAARIAAEAGIDEYYAEVLPEDKARFVEKKKAEGHRVIMVGDGINDSPALSASDAGIAINDGAEIARQIADITISSEDLESIVVLKRISTLLMKRIRFHYGTIVGFNTALIGLGIAGVLPPAISAMLHNGSTVALGLRSSTNLLPERKTP